ncbi:MAG: GTP-binding protein, partial [Flammeovirgaceae bacterium]
QGMINDLVMQSDFALGESLLNELEQLEAKNPVAIARLITAAENYRDKHVKIFDHIKSLADRSKAPVLGITGTGGAGKSSMVDEIVRRFLLDFKDKSIGLISVDPSKRKTGGALLGDRIRMNAINNPRVFMRSLATRQSNLALSAYVKEAIQVLKAAQYDLIILETSGIGQSDTEILDHSDVSLYIMTPEYGAATQLEKIDMLDFADVIALNKFDKRGALDALRDVKKQYQRNHQLWDRKMDDMPVFGTIASQFNDPGTNQLYKHLMDKIVEKTNASLTSTFTITREMSEKIFVIPPHRTRYLSEISENNRKYDQWVNQQSEVAQNLYALHRAKEIVKPNDSPIQKALESQALNLDPKNWKLIESFPAKAKQYKDELFKFKVRDIEIGIKTHTESLSHLQIPKVSLPRYEAWGDLLKWQLQENVPGEFP